MDYCMYFFTSTFPWLLQGLLITLIISVAAMTISMLFGLLMGIALCNQMRIRIVDWFFELYVWCFRCIPFYPQLLIVYFLIPHIFNISLSPISSGILALGLCSTAYVAEIIRGCINSLFIGQWEACYVLGLSRYATLRYVILPQTFERALSPLANEFIQIIHATAIIGTIGALELTKVGSNIIAREMNPGIILPAVAFLYLIVTTFFAFIIRLIERRSHYV